MPVIPNGILPFTIKAPLTSTDKGQPTDDILNDAKRVFDFIEDERHLTALDLYKSVMNRITAWDKAHKRKGRHTNSSRISSSTTSNNSSSRNNNNNNKHPRSLFWAGGGGGGGGGRHKKNAGKTTDTTLAAAANDQAHSDAKAFLQGRHPQIVKLEVRGG